MNTTKRIVSFILALVMVLSLLPGQVFAAAETDRPVSELAGKTISILGASISTYAGISNNAEYNSTIGSNAVYYTEGRYGVYAEDTWWMQAAEDLGLRLLVNNSWSGSSLLYERSGTVGAYVDRCVQLHNNDGEEPDIIGIQMGTNDFQYYKDTLGTADIDYGALITGNETDGFTYAEPTTSLEAAAIVLHKISVRYPNAEVYYLNISQRVDGTDELIRSFNAELKQVVEHFGAHTVDIYGSAITMEDFDTYIGDGRVHPNKLGMDAYTEAFKRAVVANTEYALDTHTVSFDLEGVTADYGDDRIVVSGDAFRVSLTAADDLRVTVTMGGEDITAAAYADGTVSIDDVTGDVTVTAASVHTPECYRWEFDGTDLICTDESNALTKQSGTTADGVFSNTSYALTDAVVLKHDLPWTVEWKCEGTFQNSGSSSGARIFTSDDVNANYNARYIFKSNKNGLIAMGEKTASGSHNYGIALGDHGIDWTAEHTYLLENRIADDGGNTVYLWVDGAEIGAMDRYYVGTTDQNTTSDWISGKDFVFPYMGTDTHGFTNASIEYISVAECAHAYESGVCTACGETIDQPSWEQGTIGAANGFEKEYANVIRTSEYLRLSDYVGMTLNAKHYITYFVYDADYNYLGNGKADLTANFLLSGQGISTHEMLIRYPEGKYFRIALWRGKNEEMTPDMLEGADVNFLTAGHDPVFWEMGSIYAANGIAFVREQVIRSVNYLPVKDYAGVTVKDGYAISFLAYDEELNYLGNGNPAKSGYFIPGRVTMQQILDDYPEAEYIRLLLAEEPRADFTMEAVELSGIRLYKAGETVPEKTYPYQGLETSFEVNFANGLLNIRDGTYHVTDSGFVTTETLPLEHISKITWVNDYAVLWGAYNAQNEYLGSCASYLTSGEITKSGILAVCGEACYIVLSVKPVSRKNLELAEMVTESGLAIHRDLSHTGSIAFDTVMQAQKSQDGAIYKNTLFLFDKYGQCTVYNTNSKLKLGSFTLDRVDVLNPHANSVCFSDVYYAQGDPFPLLYVNIYNNYRTTADPKEGTCCVYRIFEENGTYSSKLVQVLKIGFTGDYDLWNSAEGNGYHYYLPYGNFIVDTDEDKLWAFVLRNADNQTRFFCFDLPDLSEGAYNDAYDCNLVTLEAADIKDMFDLEHFEIIQGCTYADGKIYSANGLGTSSGYNSFAELKVIDLRSKAVAAVVDFGDLGFSLEPEMIGFNIGGDGQLYYMSIDGTLRRLRFVDETVNTVQVGNNEHTYSPAVTAPTCTEQGYTTYTCECGDSYVADYVEPYGLHDVDTDKLCNTITVKPGQLDSSTDGDILDSDVYGFVVNYPLKKGHVLSISDTDYVFSVRKLEDGTYSTMLKSATADSYTAAEDMTVAMLIRKPDKSALTAEELENIVIYDSQFGMIGVEGSVRRFTVDAETIDGGTAATRAAIFLPDSYSDSGAPTRLIVMTNGLHGYLTDSVWNSNTVDDVGVMRHYMENGYAVVVVNNTANRINGAPDWGNPQLVDSYWKAYEYVQENLNVEEMFSIHSRSMGTFAAVRLMREHPERIKCALMCGAVLSLRSRFSTGPAHIARRYGFDDTTGATWEADKVVGYDPYTDVNGLEYDLPPTFWMLAEADATAAHLSVIGKIQNHGNDVTKTVYTDTDHSGVCRLNIEACRVDSLAFLEKYQDARPEHRFCAWQTVKEATCTEAGELRRTCADCSHYETMEIPALSGHVFETGGTVCGVCGLRFDVVRQEVGIIPGQFLNETGEWIASDNYGCVIGYELKAGHTLSISNTDYVFAVRVLEDGSYATMVREATADAFTADEDVTVAVRVRKPDKSALTEEELAAIVLYDTSYVEHTHTYASAVTAPTCTERGYTTYTCECGDSYVGDYTDRRPLNILMIGNSFSWDAADCGYGLTTSQTYSAMKSMLAEGYDVHLGVMYRGSATLAYHATCAMNHSGGYTYTEIGPETGYVWNPPSGGAQPNYILDHLNERDWDIIVIQAYQHEADGTEPRSTYTGGDARFEDPRDSVGYLLDYFAEHEPGAEVYYYMPWASVKFYGNDGTAAGYEAIAAYTAANVPNLAGTSSGKKFAGIIPVGTGIENARTTYLNSLKFSVSGSTPPEKEVQIGLLADTQHLSLGLGRYIAGMVVAETLIPQEMRKDDPEWPPVRDSYALGALPKEYSAVAQLAAGYAVEHPFRVTVLEGYETDPADRICDAIECAAYTAKGISDEAALLAYVQAVVNGYLTEAGDAESVVTLNHYVLTGGGIESLDAAVKIRVGYTERTAQIYVVDGQSHRFGEWVVESVPTPERPGVNSRVCTVCGFEHTVEVEGSWQKFDLSAHLQDLPDGFCSGMNLWAELEPEELMIDHLGNWVSAGAAVYSITVPVKPGDRVYANSFDVTGSRKGIQVSFIGDYGIVKTTFSSGTYQEFHANGGYLIAPEGAIAVNIPVWDVNDAANDVRILGYGHTYTPAVTAPTCTERGYTTYTCSCGDSYVADYTDCRPLNILMIGNSFSWDAADAGYGLEQSQMYDTILAMLKEGCSVELGVVVRGGTKLNYHYAHIEDATDYKYSKITQESGKWDPSTPSANTSISEVLESEDWDIVVVQPYREEMTGGNNAETSLKDLLDYLAVHEEGAKVYYYMPWAATDVSNGDTLAKYREIAAFTAGNIMDIRGTASGNTFAGIVPVGTGIQNARGTYLNSLYYSEAEGGAQPGIDSQRGLERDKQHVSFGIGRYIAGVVMAESLIPQEMRKDSYEWPDIKDSAAVGALPAEYTEIAKQAVSAALANPYAVTEIAGYETDPADTAKNAIEQAGYDFSGISDSDELAAAIGEAVKPYLGEGFTAPVVEVETYLLDDNGNATDFVASVTFRYGYSARIATITKHTHAYASAVTLPTCTEQGYTTYTCSCGDSYVADYVDATGHTYSNGTCTACGAADPDYVAVVFGDANGDGTVNGKDLLMLRRYMANYDDETKTSTIRVGVGADANGDGEVNGKDLLMLRRYMANYDDETQTSTVVLGPQNR